MTDVANSGSTYATTAAAVPVRLIDLVFPGDTNHHGTLFGGAALAHMGKDAFYASGKVRF